MNDYLETWCCSSIKSGGPKMTIIEVNAKKITCGFFKSYEAECGEILYDDEYIKIDFPAYLNLFIEV